MSKPDGSQPEKPLTMADLVEATTQLEKAYRCPKCDGLTLNWAFILALPLTKVPRFGRYCNACGHMEEQ